MWMIWFIHMYAASNPTWRWHVSAGTSSLCPNGFLPLTNEQYRHWVFVPGSHSAHQVVSRGAMPSCCHCYATKRRQAHSSCHRNWCKLVGIPSWEEEFWQLQSWRRLRNGIYALRSFEGTRQGSRCWRRNMSHAQKPWKKFLKGILTWCWMLVACDPPMCPWRMMRYFKATSGMITARGFAL